jgi:hypothetical protein
MSNARDTVTAAYRMIGGIDINTEEPSPALMTRGLDWLTKLLDQWTGEGLNLATQVITGTLAASSSIVTGLSSTAALAPGMNASGTGIPVAARILTIDSPTQVTLDAAATTPGTVSITFAALPFQPRYQLGVEALLALALAPLIGEDEIPPWVVATANRGWDLLVGNFYVVPDASYDPALTSTSVRRTSAFNA